MTASDRVARWVATARPPSGAVAILRLGQSGFALRAGGVTLLVDPFLSARPDLLAPPVAGPEDLGAIDAVLATHEHPDHLDVASWPRFASAGPAVRFVVPEPLVDRVSAAVLSDRVIGAAVDRRIDVAGARIHPVPASHGVHVADAYTFGREHSNGYHRYLGYVFELAGVRLYHAGDTVRYEGDAERLRAYDIDVALLPINGRDAEREARDIVGNLGPVEAADLAAAAGIPVVVPMHHDTVAGNTGRVADLFEYAERRRLALSFAVLGLAGSIVLASGE
ncbi:MAG: MBL fold metallo-hydrolase [Candidatus Limnocylindria bacterium]